ncbi:retrotransposable element Tf2 [Tanacetum coccineum]
MPIRMFKITNLTDVYAMAKMQEATNAVLKPRYNSSLLSTPKFVPNSVNKSVNAPLKSATVNGHKYSGQLYSLEVVSENDNELVTEVEDAAFKDCVEEVITIESSPQISLNALSGLNSFQTMRVKGMFGKHTLHILVDCGSTHNLLDLKTAKNIGYKFDNTTPLQVSVANGQNMMSCYECKNFQWSLQGETFTSDVMLLPLGGCEMFEYNGRRMVLRGTKNTTIHWMQGKSASKSGQIKQAELASMVLCVYPVSLWQMDGTTNVNKEVNKFLAKFKRVFEILTELPPQRTHDHQIPLMPNKPPINVRPYRHP